jgi:hypothetical protein
VYVQVKCPEVAPMPPAKSFDSKPSAKLVLSPASLLASRLSAVCEKVAGELPGVETLML